jgi:hypothetical protein
MVPVEHAIMATWVEICRKISVAVNVGESVLAADDMVAVRLRWRSNVLG